MKCMECNKTAFYYALYASRTELTDDYGNKTGEYQINYGNPVKEYGNISAAKGEMQNQQFGESEAYDKVIVLGNPQTSIDEHSILWVDSTPIMAQNGSTTTPHDYIVKKVARSLNSVSIAVSKVDVCV